MCNMAELAGGTMTEVTVPSTHRWIPKGMTVEYLKKGRNRLNCSCNACRKNYDWDKAGEYLVNVEVYDSQKEKVFQATITMWISKKK